MTICWFQRLLILSLVTKATARRWAVTNTEDTCVQLDSLPYEPTPICGERTHLATPSCSGHPKSKAKALGQMTVPSQCCHSVMLSQHPSSSGLQWGGQRVCPKGGGGAADLPPDTDGSSVRQPFRWAVGAARLPCPKHGQSL